MRGLNPTWLYYSLGADLEMGLKDSSSRLIGIGKNFNFMTLLRYYEPYI